MRYSTNNPVVALALGTLAVFSLGCLGMGGSDVEVDGTVRDGGFWDNFGAAGAGESGSVDSDGDGLTDAEEEELGSDPDNPDSDDDGWTDLEEVEGNTDPTDKSDHPYTGGWAIGDCRNDLDGEGYGVGDIVENVTATDQFGDTLKLHDFCDKEVFLVHAAFW